MFLGTHTPKLDDKGRLILPAKFRDELADGLVIAKFQERCLAIWPISSFVDMTKTVRSASSSQQGVRDYQRILVVGAIDRVEVWNPVAWDQYSAEKEPAFAELNQTLFPGG